MPSFDVNDPNKFVDSDFEDTDDETAFDNPELDILIESNGHASRKKSKKQKQPSLPPPPRQAQNIKSPSASSTPSISPIKINSAKRMLEISDTSEKLVKKLTTLSKETEAERST
jgi:ribosomal protein S10